MFLAKKILEKLLSPLGLTVAALLLTALLARKRPRGARVAAIFGLFVIIVPSMPTVADGLLGSLEDYTPAIPLAQLPASDAIVVLGGTVLPQWSEQFQPEEIAGSRLLTALRLFRLEKARRILVSSGISYTGADGVTRTEGEDMRDILVTMGVPPLAITVENRSQDTDDNAKFSAELLLPNSKQILLVSSAYHMHRATLWFRKAGFTVHPVGAGRSVRPARYSAFGGIVGLLPSAGALLRSTSALKEYFGLVPALKPES